MKRLTSLLSAVLLGSFTLSAVAAHTHMPTPSTWELNVAASDFGSGPTIKSERMTILTDNEKWLKWTDVAVDGDGKTSKTSWSGPQDGTMKPVGGMPGAAAGFKTAGESSHWVNPDGSTTDTILVMSPDKKKVTITATTKANDGKEYHQTWVYDRVK